MDQKNLILAIALSLAILLGWQMLVEQPQREAQLAEEQRQAELAGRNPESIGVPELPSAENDGAARALAAAGPRDRTEVIAETERVRIETPSYTGSINLTGGRFDDLVLRNYRQTVEPDSANITLLSPRGSNNPYFAEFGWLTGNGTVTGGGRTQWTADKTTLTQDSPVVLTARTSDGLLLTRTIAVDERYMFTVTDRVENTGGAPVNVSPFGRVTRVNEPDTLGFFILHEGPIGVLDGTLHEIDYDDLEDDPSRPETFQSTGGWLGFTDIYWLTALVPGNDETVDARFLFDTTPAGAKLYQADFRSAATSLAPGESVENTQRLFAGAKVFNVLKNYEVEYEIERFEMAIDFGWFFFLTKPLLDVIIFFADFLGNFGLSILLV
ncbi:MAG: membrane protein insertase YidC, partial [Alphaproteobacteria bacterium]|nr:membrane protein insertase YidC [Alphaproteobacteria bacterium]